MGNVLLYLPKQRYDTLLYLLEFLFYVDQYKAHNKMDIGNLSIMFAPNIIECPETTDMQTTLIAPLHITNTIIHYFKRLRIQVIIILNKLYSYFIYNNKNIENNKIIFL